MYSGVLASSGVSAAWLWTYSLVMWPPTDCESIQHLERDTQCRSDIHFYDADQTHMMSQIIFNRHHTQSLWLRLVWYALLFEYQGPCYILEMWCRVPDCISKISNRTACLKTDVGTDKKLLNTHFVTRIISDLYAECSLWQKNWKALQCFASGKQSVYTASS